MNTAKTVYITDDSAFMRQILRDILEQAGFTTISEYGNGQECLAACAKAKPDLLLLDIVMPEMDGLEVLKKIGHQLDIIVISAVGQDKMVEDAKMLGAKGYIVKPFEAKDVLAELQKIVG